MSSPEAARKTGEPTVVSLSPDVCLTGGAPVPYSIVAKFPSSSQVANTVLLTRDPTFTWFSTIEGVIGDEAGDGGGVASGTSSGGAFTHCVDGCHASNVYAEKHQIVRHLDEMEMNAPSPRGPGNTIGMLLFMDVDRNPPPLYSASSFFPETPEELEAQLAEGGEDGGPKHSFKGSHNRSSSPLTRGGGFGDSAGHSPSRSSTKSSVNWSSTTTEQSSLWASSPDYDNNTSFGYRESTRTHQAGYADDGSWGYKYGGSESVVTMRTRRTYESDRGKVQGTMEVLGGEAKADAGISAGPDGVVAKAEAGLIGYLIRGTLDGSMNISFQEMVENALPAYRLMNWLYDDELDLPDWLGDNQIVISAIGELFLGAGAEGEVHARANNESVSAGGTFKVGVGPGAGLKVNGGLQFSEGIQDFFSSLFTPSPATPGGGGRGRRARRARPASAPSTPRGGTE
ncbi:MAG: PAAR-like domain-containing protein [Sandaracinaceae bacterium]